MKFSLIGNGFIFPTHLKAIQGNGGEIVGRDTDEDCVVIISPNDTHYEYAKKYAEQGKIVLCEKPLAITSEQAKELAKYDNIYTVLQLRHHRFLKEMKGKNVVMDISVYRDDKYHKGWKGDEERSGGILFNLGIHYFDVLFTAFGKPKSAKITSKGDRTIYGTIEGENYNCNFKLSTAEQRENQRRKFKVDGKEYDFSKKDNLAYENYHFDVYRDIIHGHGVKAKDVVELIDFIEQLKLNGKYEVNHNR